MGYVKVQLRVGLALVKSVPVVFVSVPAVVQATSLTILLLLLLLLPKMRSVIFVGKSIKVVVVVVVVVVVSGVCSCAAVLGQCAS